MKNIPDYNSSNSDVSSELNSQNVLHPKPKNVHKNWEFIERYDNKPVAEAAVSKEGLWSKYYKSATIEGNKVYYRCNKGKYRAKQCSAAMYFCFDSNSENVTMYKTVDDHDHENATQALSTDIKLFIDDIYKKNVKKPYGPTSISLGELEQWSINNETQKEFEFTFKIIQKGLQLTDMELMSPKVLIADAADSIKIGFEKVFGDDYIRVISWAHARRAIEQKLRSSENAIELLDILKKLGTA